MLPKNKRIPRKLFKSLLESRKYFNSQNFSVRYAISGDTRVAVSVSKKVSKKAVVRNKVRRRSYSAMRDILPHLSGGLYLISAKSGSEKIKYESIKQELAELFKKR